jgi:hypothetical protein
VRQGRLSDLIDYVTALKALLSGETAEVDGKAARMLHGR